MTLFRVRLRGFAGLACLIAATIGLGAQAPKAQPPKTLRLYVFDCGVISPNRAGTERYKVTPEEVGETRFSVPCFLIAHPRGTLVWDLGVVPDPTIEARAAGREPMPTS